jgi:hypothetical protein
MKNWNFGKWLLKYGNVLVNDANDFVLQPTKQIKISKNITSLETSEGSTSVGKYQSFIKSLKLSNLYLNKECFCTVLLLYK